MSRGLNFPGVTSLVNVGDIYDFVLYLVANAEDRHNASRATFFPFCFSGKMILSSSKFPRYACGSDGEERERISIFCLWYCSLTVTIRIILIIRRNLSWRSKSPIPSEFHPERPFPVESQGFQPFRFSTVINHEIFSFVSDTRDTAHAS